MGSIIPSVSSLCGLIMKAEQYWNEMHLFLVFAFGLYKLSPLNNEDKDNKWK